MTLRLRGQELTELTPDELSDVSGAVSALLCLTRISGCHQSACMPCQPPPTDYC